jgi:hypothetical protein
MPELQRSRAQLESEQAGIVSEIQTIRKEARDYNLRCQASHEPQDVKQAQRRRERISELQSALMDVQGRLGEVNRGLRAQKPSQIAGGRVRARQEAERRENDFLNMFYQICKDSLHPKQFEALQDGAKALLREAERIEESED